MISGRFLQTDGCGDDPCTDKQTAIGRISLSQRPLHHHFLDWQCLVLRGVVGNGVPLWPQAALKKRGCLIGLLLDRAPEGIVLPRPVTAERRLADIDDDDITAEVHHLTAGDEGGVVVPRHLTWMGGGGRKRRFWIVRSRKHIMESNTYTFGYKWATVTKSHDKWINISL